MHPLRKLRESGKPKKAGKAAHEKLIADQRIVADTRGDESSFPRHSTAAKRNRK